MPLGLYISVPFCRPKCSYCNFASDVFSRAVFENYIKRLCAEIEQSGENANQLGAALDRSIVPAGVRPFGYSVFPDWAK